MQLPMPKSNVNWIACKRNRLSNSLIIGTCTGLKVHCTCTRRSGRLHVLERETMGYVAVFGRKKENKREANRRNVERTKEQQYSRTAAHNGTLFSAQCSMRSYCTNGILPFVYCWLLIAVFVVVCHNSGSGSSACSLCVTRQLVHRITSLVVAVQSIYSEFFVSRPFILGSSRQNLRDWSLALSWSELLSFDFLLVLMQFFVLLSSFCLSLFPSSSFFFAPLCSSLLFFAFLRSSILFFALFGSSLLVSALLCPFQFHYKTYALQFHLKT